MIVANRMADTSASKACLYVTMKQTAEHQLCRGGHSLYWDHSFVEHRLVVPLRYDGSMKCGVLLCRRDANGKANTSMHNAPYKHHHCS